MQGHCTACIINIEQDQACSCLKCMNEGLTYSMVLNLLLPEFANFSASPAPSNLYGLQGGLLSGTLNLTLAS